MKKRGTLIETNPYLADPVMREKIFFENAVASATISGVKNARQRLTKLLEKEKNKSKFSTEKTKSKK